MKGRRLHPVRVTVSVLACLLAYVSVARADQQTLRTYVVGNSLSLGVNLPNLESLASTRGDTFTYGNHIRTGQSLQYMWENPTDAEYTTPPYNLYQNALSNYQWDAITLQPFARPLEGPTGDRVHASNFINYARNNSPDAQFYVYQQWPQLASSSSNFDQLWLQSYSGGNDQTIRTRDYYQQLTVALRQDYAALDKPVLMIPAGDVMHELNQRMHDGQVPGFNDISEFYGDNIHLNPVGSYMLAVTFYATMFKEDPNGLPYDTSIITDPAVAAQIQDAVWDVVSTHPLTGIPEPTSAGVLTIIGAALALRRRRPAR